MYDVSWKNNDVNIVILWKEKYDFYIVSWKKYDVYVLWAEKTPMMYALQIEIKTETNWKNLNKT